MFNFNFTLDTFQTIKDRGNKKTGKVVCSKTPDVTFKPSGHTALKTDMILLRILLHGLRNTKPLSLNAI